MINRKALQLKDKLAAGHTSPGIWVSLPSPTTCEIIAGVGYDWIVVDAEHSPFNPETLQYMLMAFKDSQTVPLIRVPDNDPVIIKQMLDMGWSGVLVPQVTTVEEATRAIQACRYPPLGNRGFGPRRAGNYYRDQAEYTELANDMVICIIQIEDIRASDHIEKIVRIPGLDWIFVGRCDMSGSAGKFCDPDCPEVWDTVKKVFKVAQAAGIPAGNVSAGVNYIEQALDLGCPLVTLGEDTGFLKETADQSLKIYHDILKSRKAS